MRITDKYVFFWNGIYSNWYPCKFTVEDRTFNCSEQFMMYCKAMYFKDFEIVEQVMKTENPKLQKSLGRKVKNFDPVEWDKVCMDYVYDGCLAKFDQNEWLRIRLLVEGNKRNFVEASPYDKIWGVGLDENNPLIDNPVNWKGKNYLGKMLDKVYTTLKSKEVR